jgi:ribonuclease T2
MTIFASLSITGITDDGSSYSVSSIKNALTSGIGQTSGIECNRDSSGTRQLYQVYTCVDKDASTIIQCPTFPSSGCGSSATIPSF